MLRLSAVIFVLISFVGCGGEPRGEIRGTVTYKDEPVEYAIVMAIGEDQNIYRADTDQLGSFRISGVPYGKQKVAVQRPMRESEAPPIEDHLDAPGAPSSSSTSQSKVPTIPVRYANPTTSDLLVTVSGEKTQYDIELK